MAKELNWENYQFASKRICAEIVEIVVSSTVQPENVCDSIKDLAWLELAGARRGLWREDLVPSSVIITTVAFFDNHRLRNLSKGRRYAKPARLTLTFSFKPRYSIWCITCRHHMISSTESFLSDPSPIIVYPCQ